MIFGKKIKRILPINELRISDKNVKSKSVKGGLELIIGQIVSFLLLIISTMILARILSPEDYGIIGIVTAITGFFTLFKEFGLTISIIKKKILTNLELITVFWLYVIVGTVLMILMMIMSVPIAKFYDDSRLIDVTIIISLTFLIGSFSIVPSALLKRTMQFRKLIYSQLIASFFGAIMTIISAYIGLGYWSLVINILVTTFINSLLVIWSFGWFPKIKLYINSIKNHLEVGKNITLFDLVNYFARNLDNLIIGKYYGSSMLGLYSKAYQLLLLPIQKIRTPIYSVALPALASLREKPKEYNAYYLQLVSILNIISLLLICFLWLNSYEIIYFVLGEKWLLSAEFFSVLAFAALIQPVYGTLGLVLITLGKSRKYLHWGILNFMIIAIGFIVGINFDLKTFILIYVIANYISFLISVPFVFHDTPINIVNFLKNIFVPFTYIFGGAYIIQKNIDILKFSMGENFVVKTSLFLAMTFFIFIFSAKHRNNLAKIREILKPKKEKHVH
ncbi:lipopolysaccharide biosynthesis protein [Sulfurovum sp.]|uniref:lipopolysaccharide biosynthesis protein n=1 Tax=Sulfurovum sp. TaxID=1969726 RepID=UPI00356A95A1